MKLDKDIANLLILLIIVVIAYFSIWLFNHINAWLGIGLFLLLIFSIFKQLKQIK